MKLLFYFTAFLLSFSTVAQIKGKAILVDTHNDILYKILDSGYKFDSDLSGITQTDLTRLKKGRVNLQFFSVFCDGEQKHPYNYAMRAMDTLEAIVKRNPDNLTLITSSKELRRAIKQDKLAAFFGVEGGHMIENDFDKLRTLYNRGARYLTLTWNNSTDWASSAYDETFRNDQLKNKGLSDFGKKVVSEMNKLGMMIDVSHLGIKSFWDLMSITKKPVIASHSSVYAFCHHQRNLNDEQIKAIGVNGGVIQVNFYSGFLDSSYERKKNEFFRRHQSEVDSMIKLGLADYRRESYLFQSYPAEVSTLRPPLSLLIDHIEYIIRLAGIDHVGLGSDFDGIESAPISLDDVTSYPLIVKALRDRGYNGRSINKILGGNLLRVLKANEKN